METDAPREPPTLNAVLAVLTAVAWAGLGVGALQAPGLDATLAGVWASGPVLGDWTETLELAGHTYTLDTAPMVVWQGLLGVGATAVLARLLPSGRVLGGVWRGGGCGSLLLLFIGAAGLLWSGVWMLWLTADLPEPEGRLDDLLPGTSGRTARGCGWGRR